MTEEKNVTIKMKSYFRGKLNGYERWEAGVIKEVAADVADELINELGKAVKATSKEIKEAANA